MKKTMILTAMFLVLFTFVHISAQENKGSEEEKLYWFSIRINSIIDKELKVPVNKVSEIYRNIQAGSFAEFAKAYKKNLKKNKLCIGPFSNKMYADLAQKSYELCNLDSNAARGKLNSMNVNQGDYFFYLAEPSFSEINKSIHFNKRPTNIACGSIKEFVDLFIEANTHRLLAIGPFDTKLMAEKSKFLIRKFGESNTKSPENETKVPQELKAMAESWKSIKVEISVEPFSDNVEAKLCKLNFIFPPQYFDQNTVQVITIGYLNNKTQVNFKDGITLQGTMIQDINPVISFENGGTTSYLAAIPNSDFKDCQIILKATLFSNLHVLNCEDIILKIKAE